jgi:hypothetical protein
MLVESVLQNDVEYIRLRTKEKEVLVAPGEQRPCWLPCRLCHRLFAAVLYAARRSRAAFSRDTPLCTAAGQDYMVIVIQKWRPSEWAESK